MLCQMFVLAAVATMALQTSGILNGRFEDGTANWSQASYGARPVPSLDSALGRGGRTALRISSSDPTDTAFGQDISVVPGEIYRLSAWVKTRGLDPLGAPVFGTIQAQLAQGAGILATGVNHAGDTDWTQENVYFLGPQTGKARVSLFFCGWGKGTGTVWFDDVELQTVAVDHTPLRITGTPLCPGRISPFQYGQFIEYLCDLVPSMWAEKLYDGSFEGLTPYKFVFVKETDFTEKPWYPVGERNRLRVEPDTTRSISGPTSKRIELSAGAPCEGGVAQDGISLNKGVACKFSIFARGTVPGRFRVRLFHGLNEYAHATLSVGADWQKVSATLDPSATTSDATISIVFEGPGSYWLDSASLMPTDSVGGWRKDVFQVLRALNPGIIRVGGSVLDDSNLGTFEWTDTIGDPDRRTPFHAWGGLQPTGPGLEELVQLIQGVGAEPLICLRYEKKTPEDAAKEVEYFNGSVNTPMGAMRAANGHPKPYRIKYWQIGNERWGEAYWHAVPLFAKAIRSVDPSVKLLSSFPSEELIKGAAPELDFVSPHQYDVADLSGSRQELETARKLIADFGGGRALKLGVTEWNTTAGDAGLMRAKLWTLSNALACSRYQNLLHREADLVEIANRSNLTNSFCSGVIQTNRAGLYLTPTYYAQQLYATMAGTRPLKIESELPSDLLPDVSATLSEDGKWLTIFAVNDQTQAVRRVLDLSEFDNAGQDAAVVTLADTQRAGHPDVTNGFDDPKRVFPLKSTFRAGSARFDYAFPPLSLTVLRWKVASRQVDR
jgi:alpha-L-arabinofuranosidase